MGTGVFVYDFSGATGIWRWWEGEDPVTLQTYTGSQRLFHGVLGALQLTTLAFCGAGMLHAMRGPCGGYIFRRCFVGDTEVVLYPNNTGVTVAQTWPANVDADPTGLLEGLKGVAQAFVLD